LESVIPYFTNIEARIAERLENANSSIMIAMAWLTNPFMKELLLTLKKKNPALNINIVVDPNHTNQLYFFNSESELLLAGIFIDKLATSKFLHHKFIVIDKLTVITGSYNLTRRAKRNLENIVVIENADIADSYCREYYFLTMLDYMDQNIKLLFEFPGFAQKLLSTYYSFSKAEFKQYRNKIVQGKCFTAENGFWNELHYEPGYIFNSTCPVNLLEDWEFFIPVNKKVIKEWTLLRNQDSILESFRDFQDRYDQINDELERNEQDITEHFKAQIEHTYTADCLRKMIVEGVDIILEDQLWPNNFKRFISPAIIAQLFDRFNLAEKWEVRLLF
jgi:PLD-like domain